MKISDEKLKKLVLEIIGSVDYDISKFYSEDTSEDWEAAEQQMKRHIEVARKILEEK